MSQFLALLQSHAGQGVGLRIPIIGLAQAGRSGYFDDSGFPVASGWETLDFPNLGDINAYALEICGESMEPVNRKGDVVMVSLNSAVLAADCVVV